MIAPNPAMALTPKQVEILTCIRDWQTRHGSCPSYDELGKACGGVTRPTIAQHVKALEARGAIRRRPGRTRSLEILDPRYIPGGGECPSCGHVLSVLQALVAAVDGRDQEATVVALEAARQIAGSR